MTRAKAFLVLVSGLALSGCVSDAGRVDGVTMGAGNAIAANTVMQMVDPWQRGVQDTDLEVPATRPDSGAAEEDGSDASASSSDD